MSELGENPIVKKRRRNNLVIGALLLGVFGGMFISGAWGVVWSKFSRFWLFDQS